MASVLPSVARYLELLPDGEASYPECQVKASVLRSSLDERPLGRDVPLPPAVRALVDHPPPVSVWVPEVHFNCTMLAVHEVHFAPPLDAGYLDWVYERNVRLFKTPLYRALFLVLSPERLLVGLEKRWASFRRGTELRLAWQAPRDIELHIITPPNHYPQLVVDGMAQALRAAVSCAGAKNVRVDGAPISPTTVSCRIRWG
jgi:uncharacterized protein (TIGR02265 family)